MANLTFLFFAPHFWLIISHRRWNDSCSLIIHMISENASLCFNTTEGKAMKGLLSVVRCSLVVVLIMPLLISSNGCSKKEDVKEQAKREQKQDVKGSATLENLKSGYASEVKHASWYEVFAKQAQKENMSGVAVVFRALSQSEKVHADNLANLLKARGVDPVAPVIEPPPPGKTNQYLKSAASSERVETESMYPAFIKTANDEKDSVAAQLFTQTLGADERHGRLLKKVMEEGLTISKLPYMMCPRCGYIVGSEKDEECRVCKAKKETFKKL
jgi:rubrerythrin